MKHKTKRRFNNRLAIVRRRKLLNQKQVSGLLGNKSNDQISRYERGVQVPNLKNALKLGRIYNIPIRVLLDGYYEACRKEIIQESGSDKIGTVPISDDTENDLQFCTFEERLKRKKIDNDTLDQISAHAAKLIRRRAETLGHI